MLSQRQTLALQEVDNEIRTAQAQMVSDQQGKGSSSKRARSVIRKSKHWTKTTHASSIHGTTKPFLGLPFQPTSPWMEAPDMQSMSF